MNLAARARAIGPATGRSPWGGHEYARGYGVLNLPFDSGHLLGLRVFPENDFAPYVSVWHRSPAGAWAIYVDGPSLETSCPRYWGSAIRTAAFADIDVTWTGPTDLRVTMDEPALVWTLSMGAPRLHRVLNAVEGALPLWTWRIRALRRLREAVARHALGYGDIDLSFTTASRHEAVLLARRNYRIEASGATLRGRSLGEPTTLDENPAIGGVALPKAPSFAFGQAQAAIQDRAAYERLRATVQGE